MFVFRGRLRYHPPQITILQCHRVICTAASVHANARAALDVVQLLYVDKWKARSSVCGQKGTPLRVCKDRPTPSIASIHIIFNRKKHSLVLVEGQGQGESRSIRYFSSTRSMIY